jgi:hypothetical protein
MVLVKAILVAGVMSLASVSYGMTVGCGTTDVEDGPSVSISLNDESGAAEQISISYDETTSPKVFDQIRARISNTVPIGYYAGRNSSDGNSVAIDIQSPWTNNSFAFKGTMTVFSVYGVEIFDIGCNLRNE